MSDEHGFADSMDYCSGQISSELSCSIPFRFITKEGFKTMEPGKRYDENLNEIEPVSNTCDWNNIEISLPDDGFEISLPKMSRINACARCGSDVGIQRNLDYKIAICEECWKK